VNIKTNSINLEAESILDDQIEFKCSLTKNIFHNQTILLTGSTGLLGNYLLYELLNQTNGLIYCIVRSESDKFAKNKVIEQMKYLELWNSSFENRIIAIIGDLSKPLIGIDKQKYDHLCEEVDVIYHNGAQINSMFSYKALKPVNVLSTIELVKLASLKKTKVFHYISSIAVFFSGLYLNNIVKEHEYPEYDSLFKGGYRQTKWVSEHIMLNAIKKGLPASIYRPGLILGHSKTGMTPNFNNLFYNVIKSVLFLKKYPELKSKMNICPVDFVSKAIINISMNERSIGNNFHITNPISITWNEIFKIIKSIGYDITPSNFHDWIEDLTQFAKKNPRHNFSIMLRNLKSSQFNIFTEKPEFDTMKTQKILAKSLLFCPEVNEKLITTYFTFMKHKNFLNEM